jgi:putative CocE/NonD family hydrolase
MKTGGKMRYMTFLIMAGTVLTTTVPARAAAPTPRYGVRVEVNVRVPMRDGVKLATDLYFPERAVGKVPAILIRTPYNRKNRTSAARMFAGQGYVVAVQDVRGKFDSEGHFTLSANDTGDGSDTLDWIAAQPWSTGKIGTYGCSYLAEDQLELAKVRNSHHTAMIPQAGGGAYRFADLREGGAVGLAEAAPWFLTWGSKIDPNPANSKVDIERMFLTLPLIDMLKKAGGPPTDFDDFVSHEPMDPWWDHVGYVNAKHHFNTPGLQVCSWYDSVVNETFELMNLMRRNGESESARENQFVVIAPSTHCGWESANEHTLVGKREMGDTRFPYDDLYMRWFDHWLKGADNGVTREPKVRIYVMGANRWREENEWPLKRTKFTKYYLHSDGHANTRAGTGVLSVRAPEGEASDHFRYDPENPVPTNSEGAQDQSAVEQRPDVLVYSTAALDKGIELTGPIQAVLYLSSSAKDTDFTAKLVDVYPDGRAFNIQDGILRARYRDGFDHSVWMKPGESYRLQIDLHSTSNYFPAGHRIRLEISSSNFPRFDRNLNTGGRNYDEARPVVAENEIHHAAGRESYILLPVIP